RRGEREVRDASCAHAIPGDSALVARIGEARIGERRRGGAQERFRFGERRALDRSLAFEPRGGALLDRGAGTRRVHQVVANALALVGEVDGDVVQSMLDSRADTGLFLHLAHGRLLGTLAWIDVAFGQYPMLRIASRRDDEEFSTTVALAV